MEFLRDVLTFKVVRQEIALRKAGVTGILRQELIGPEYEKVRVSSIDNNKFLNLILSKRPQQILRHFVHASDTHTSYDLYLDLGQGVQVKTQAVSIDYNTEPDLLSSLQEMDYHYKQLEPKHEHGDTSWGIYMLNSEHA